MALHPSDPSFYSNIPDYPERKPNKLHRVKLSSLRETAHPVIVQLLITEVKSDNISDFSTGTTDLYTRDSDVSRVDNSN